MKLLDSSDAQRVIDNVIFTIDETADRAASISKSKRSNGMDKYFKDQINDAVSNYGVIPVGSALKFVEQYFEFDDVALYFPYKDNQSQSDRQREAQRNFDRLFSNYLNLALGMLEDEEEEMSEGDMAQYNKMRKYWSTRMGRLKSKGMESYSLPDLIQEGKRYYGDLQNLMEWVDFITSK